MRTITYSIREYDDEDIGHGFTVIETETLHTVTGDEISHIEVPEWFDDRAAAQAWIDAELEAMAPSK